VPLTAGSRLGPYEILSPLGAGGMGEVYRARDKKLDRDVAVKVLPQSVAADPDTLARFEREAKAVAALSHQDRLVRASANPADVQAAERAMRAPVRPRQNRSHAALPRRCLDL
jgi:hypothetical protein